MIRTFSAKKIRIWRLKNLKNFWKAKCQTVLDLKNYVWCNLDIREPISEVFNESFEKACLFKLFVFCSKQIHQSIRVCLLWGQKSQLKIKEFSLFKQQIKEVFHFNLFSLLSLLNLFPSLASGNREEKKNQLIKTSPASSSSSSFHRPISIQHFSRLNGLRPNLFLHQKVAFAKRHARRGWQAQLLNGLYVSKSEMSFVSSKKNIAVLPNLVRQTK